LLSYLLVSVFMHVVYHGSSAPRFLKQPLRVAHGFQLFSVTIFVADTSTQIAEQGIVDLVIPVFLSSHHSESRFMIFNFTRPNIFIADTSTQIAKAS
jgi:hypothetical protein